MDYGHNQKPSNTGDFFTANTGPSLESNKEDSLDLTNESWAPHTESVQNIANEKNSSASPENTINKENQDPIRLGEIIDISMLPNTPTDNSSNIDPSKAYASSIEKKVFKIKDDKLDKRALVELKKDEAELDRTKNISDFYKKTREELMPILLDESFKEQSAWRDAA